MHLCPGGRAGESIPGRCLLSPVNQELTRKVGLARQRNYGLGAATCSCQQFWAKAGAQPYTVAESPPDACRLSPAPQPTQPCAQPCCHLERLSLCCIPGPERTHTHTATHRHRRTHTHTHSHPQTPTDTHAPPPELTQTHRRTHSRSTEACMCS